MISLTIEEVNKHLKEQLPWLDNAFGQAFKITLPSKEVKPCVYTHGAEYKSVLPDTVFSNYCFWNVSDTQVIEFIPPHNRLRYDASVIFWVNLETIFGKHYTVKDIDILKDAIIEHLGYKHYKLSKVTLKRVSSGFRNLFGEFSVIEEHTQFLMLPFHGFKFEISILERAVC